MAMLRLHKLLICMTLLTATFFATPALAGDPDTDTGCGEGLVQDEQEEPQCCLQTQIKETENGGKVCAEPPSNLSVAAAITLILSFTFLISLQCFMNHHDVDMREYAYTGISLTVSIFTAVLGFQSISGIVDNFVTEPLRTVTGWGRQTYFLVNLMHMLVWYVATQLTIAYVSCALKPSDWRRRQLAASQSDIEKTSRSNVMLDVEIKGICYGILLAHLAGFASIKFWADLQQIEPFRESPLLTMVMVPLTVLLQICLERLTDVCRESYIALIGYKDWFEEAWDEKCQHAEDDIMGLTVSVMIVNSLRFAINKYYGHKCLPNAEQKEEGSECEFRHGLADGLCLLGFGLLFVILLFLTKLVFVKMNFGIEKEEERLKRQNSRILTGRLKHSTTSKSIVSHIDDSFCSQMTKRLEDVMLTTFGMAYSWCLFHGARQLLMVMSPDFLGQERYETVLAVVLAFGVTYLSWGLIRILDALVQLDDDWTPPEVDDALKTVIRGTSIFVGFAWEQTFDASIDQLAERTRMNYGPNAPAIAKFLICSGCIGVVFLSWKWYILPFVFKKGWRYGYIFSKSDLVDRCHELAHHDRDFSIEHLHRVARNLARKNSDTRRRFSYDCDATMPMSHSRSEPPLKRSLSDDSNDYQPLAGDSVESDEEIATIPMGHSRTEPPLMRRSLSDDPSHYQPLAGDSVESMHDEEIEEIEQLRTRCKVLERELAKERMVAQLCKKHQKILEDQLADERKARSTMKTHCESCGRELMQEKLVTETKLRDYSGNVLEQSPADYMIAKLHRSRVGQNGDLHVHFRKFQEEDDAAKPAKSPMSVSSTPKSRGARSVRFADEENPSMGLVCDFPGGRDDDEDKSDKLSETGPPPSRGAADLVDKAEPNPFKSPESGSLFSRKVPELSGFQDLESNRFKFAESPLMSSREVPELSGQSFESNRFKLAESPSMSSQEVPELSGFEKAESSVFSFAESPSTTSREEPQLSGLGDIFNKNWHSFGQESGTGRFKLSSTQKALDSAADRLSPRKPDLKLSPGRQAYRDFRSNYEGSRHDFGGEQFASPHVSSLELRTPNCSKIHRGLEKILIALQESDRPDLGRITL